MRDICELEVAEVVVETDDARSISFRVPPEMSHTFQYKPGQFLTLAVPSLETGSVARCYSISSSPGSNDSMVTVTVKRTTGGYASNWLCDNMRAGQRVKVLPPAGTFTVRSWDRNLMLFAAGSGITPMMSILRTALLASTPRVTLFYANRDSDSVIFRDELHRLARSHADRFTLTEWLESERGLPSQPDLEAVASNRVDWDAYCCGPTPFMSMALNALAAVDFPSDRCHLERFTSLSGNPFEIATAAGGVDAEGTALVQAHLPNAVASEEVTQVTVEFEDEVHTFADWPADTSLLEFLESKNLRVPSSCREGECSACAVLLLQGEVAMRNNDVLDEDDIAEGTRLACQARPTTDVVHVRYE
jgi:3-ketosteroid 9alpha-monooxygenase subunit B